MADEEGAVAVAVRMRIFNQREKDASASRIIRMTREDVGSKTFITNPETEDEKEFKFDYSFNSHANDPIVGPFATQDTVFDDLGRPVMLSALEGRNVCLFAYGQTGAGKSFSMLGKSNPPEMQGIIPRTCREIFKVIDQDKGNPLVTAMVGIQVVEVYCEMINDLLADRKKWPPQGHKPKMTKDGYTCETIMQECFNYDDIESAFSFADKNRSVGSHALNPESSRAHTIYQINYQKKTKLSEDAKQCQTISTRLNLVDLAGSERMESAGTSGQMLKEGNAINLSLTALGNTIKALSEGKRAQFRESKLTLLLQASMTNGKVIMIAALSPASICFDESMSTLRFAERIKMVKIKAKKNVTLDPVAEIKKEMEEMRARMQDEIDSLKKVAGVDGAVPDSGGGGADPAEIEELKRLLEEQKESERQLKEDMEKRMRDMDETDADRQERNAKVKAQWNTALGGASMAKAEDLKVPHLLNLNEDPRLAETLVYEIAEPSVLVGRANKENPPKLEFNGMGIVKNHCTFEYDADAGTVSLVPTKGARCAVNGKQVEEKTQLRHNNRVWLGNNYAFRFALPGKEEEGDKFEGEEKADYILAEQEMAKNSQDADSSDGQVNQLSHQLSEALKKVEQANIISTDLSQEAIFSPKIVKQRRQAMGEDGQMTEESVDAVVVHVSLPQGQLTWPWDKFNARLVDMVRHWQSWQYAVSNDEAFTLPEKEEENPFVDTGYQLVGEGDCWMQSLKNMIDLEVTPTLLSVTGQSVGKMNVQICPLDKNGGEGPWDDDDLDPFIDEWDYDALKGTAIRFAVKVPKIQLEVDIKEGGQPKYRDTFVRYKVNDRDPAADFNESEHDSACTIEPKYSHNKKFELIVDEYVSHLVTKGKITFQVWGKLTASDGVRHTNHPVLPEGWKRVTAYEDPSGTLHKEPPGTS